MLLPAPATRTSTGLGVGLGVAWTFFVFVLTLAALGWASCGLAAVSYSYDAQMRLVKVVWDKGQSLTFTYDATGNRISVAVSAGDAVQKAQSSRETTQPSRPGAD